MMRPSCSLVLGLILLAISASPLAAEQTETERPKAEQANSSSPQKYLLRYKFQPGEAVRWQVVHRAKIVTTVSGTTQTAETVSSSVKLWRVTKVDDDGTATFENMVESVDMTQKLTGRAEVRYNSTKDKETPLGFENIAASLGVPLATITLNNRGTIVRREQNKVKAAAQSEGLITILLPEAPVAAGETWTLSSDADVPLPTGAVKKIKLQQKYTLAGVSNGVATIEVATQILTPIHDPALEALVIQRESHGLLRFDVDAGRVIGQQMDLDRRVVGFRGEASSLHYVTQFTEELLADQPTQHQAETASRPSPAASEAKKQ